MADSDAVTARRFGRKIVMSNGAIRSEILASCYELIFLSRHAAIGTDIIHQQEPWMARRRRTEFRILGSCEFREESGHGGVVLNIGSAVSCPRFF